MKEDKEKYGAIEENKKMKIFEWKMLFWLFALLAIWMLYVGISNIYGFQPIPDSSATVTFKAYDTSGLVWEKQVNAQKGTSAFEALLQADPLLAYEEYAGLGALVKSINGVDPPPDHFWALYVDSEQSAVGISGIAIEGDTLIEFRAQAFDTYG